MTTKFHKSLLAAIAAGCIAVPVQIMAHGDVAPQPMNTDALPEVGEEWLTENPYRAEAAGDEVWLTAVKIGDSGYNQNCARCHGLGAVSGGLAPDLRFLEAEEYGDEWFIERFRNGYTQDGTTKMPAFGDVLGQKAAWAIRTYIETRPEDGALDAASDRLHEIRDVLTKGEGDPAALKTEIQTTIEKVSYGLRYPKPPQAPVQVVLPTEDAFASSEEDSEQVPAWMDEDYVMER